MLTTIVSFCFEPFEELQKRVKKIVTDSKSKNEPKDPTKCNIFAIYSLVAPPERTAAMRSEYENGSIDYEDAKRELTIAIQEHFSGLQDRYTELKRDPHFVTDVLPQGAKWAGDEARYTLRRVRRLVGSGP